MPGYIAMQVDVSLATTGLACSPMRLLFQPQAKQHPPALATLTGEIVISRSSFFLSFVLSFFLSSSSSSSSFYLFLFVCWLRPHSLFLLFIVRRYRKSLMFNGLKIGDLVRIRSSNRVRARNFSLSAVGTHAALSLSLSLFFFSFLFFSFLSFLSPQQLDRQVATVASIPVYPNTWRDVKVRRETRGRRKKKKKKKK